MAECLVAEGVKDLEALAAVDLQQLVRDHEHYLSESTLSHCKLDAGTEAHLMRGEIEALLKEDSSLPGSVFDVPCFLDSEDLQDLEQLQNQVRHCANLVLLCTEHILTRPWCLVEIYTAQEAGIPILPVTVEKPGNKFSFPTDEFFEAMRRGELLDDAGTRTLRDCGVSLEEVEEAIRFVFERIAVTCSPHKSRAIRDAELKALLRRCATGLLLPSSDLLLPSSTFFYLLLPSTSFNLLLPSRQRERGGGP